MEKLNLGIKTVIVASECKTCRHKPLIIKKWFENHWGCVECGDPNLNKND